MHGVRQHPPMLMKMDCDSCWYSSSLFYTLVPPGNHQIGEARRKVAIFSHCSADNLCRTNEVGENGLLNSWFQGRLDMGFVACG